MAIRPRGAIEAVIGAQGRVAQRQAGEAQKLLADARATAALPWWRKLIRRPVVLSVAVALLLAGVGEAQGQRTLETGNDFIRNCQQHQTSARENYGQGLCMGVIGGIFYWAESFEVCTPEGANWGQALRVVVGYMERNPARLHLSFAELVVEAMREAWPCR
jgi:hypothetical protein